jgi:hypothetical protein
MNFLSLVNDVNGRLNEVPLTSANFATAQGFYSQAKEAVNASLRDINQDSFEWPFTHTTEEMALVANQVRYPYPANSKTINFDSFRVKGSEPLNIMTTRLRQLDYEEFLDKAADSEVFPEKYAEIPRMVFRAPDLKFGVFPPPREAYTLVYEYYVLPDPLVNWDDTPYLPQQFRHILVDGAMYYAFLFRGDAEGAAVSLDKFRMGVSNMRKIYQNRYEYVRSGYTPKSGVTRGI